MFERYTEQARRAIFFARAVTLLNGASAIDSSHLLYGLMWEDASRAQKVFGLREVFPLYKGSPHLFIEKEKLKAAEGPPLTEDSKKILARAAMEADGLRDYWIDTEHMLLGILAEPNCTAARNLVKAGITLKSARRVVVTNKSSRPDYGPVPYPQQASPLEWMISRWRTWRYRRG
jgi:ATP-dependent Clp protease ATP-binding subunit ClpA